MFIILKQYNQKYLEFFEHTGSYDEILDIFYSDDITVIRNWVKDYINIDKISYSYMPTEENIKDLTYELNDKNDSFQLLKKYKTINKGYIYNSSERVTELVYTISIYKFEKNNNRRDYNINLGSNMWGNINKEINNRVLKQLEKDCLLEIFNTIQDKINTRLSWNNTEFINLISDTIKQFKTSLYKSISKRVKKTNKRNNLYKKRNEYINYNTYDNFEENFNEENFDEENFDEENFDEENYQNYDTPTHTNQENNQNVQNDKKNIKNIYRISSCKLESLKTKLD